MGWAFKKAINIPDFVIRDKYIIPFSLNMLDKYDPSTYNHQYADINGLRMHYIDENSNSPKALLLIHGWPDL